MPNSNPSLMPNPKKKLMGGAYTRSPILCLGPEFISFIISLSFVLFFHSCEVVVVKAAVYLTNKNSAFILI
jgi:hypothetical protein